MPVFEDWLREPLRIINNIYSSDPENFDSQVNEYFENKLKNEKNYLSIPYLDEAQLHDLTPNCLVRYRCMIQDSTNPEYYISTKKLEHGITKEAISLSSKYRDIINFPDGYEVLDSQLNYIDDDHTSNCNLAQRMAFYCVPIPGEPSWVKTSCNTNSLTSNVCTIASTSNCFNGSVKRGIEENDEQVDGYQNEPGKHFNMCNEMQIDIDNLENSQCDGNINRKRTKTADDNSTKNGTQEINLNFPLPKNCEEKGVACIVKVYDNYDEFKLNDLVEFIGILSLDPSLAYCNKCDVNNDSEQCSCSNTPPSLVPRLHCIKAFHLMHNNPLLDNSLQTIQQKEDENKSEYWIKQKLNLLNSLNVQQLPLDQFMSRLRQDIIYFLQEYFLLGDTLAAEYLLMNMISSVFGRKDVTVLGKFTLNLTNVPTYQPHNVQQQAFVEKQEEPKTTFTNIFYKYFKELVSMSHFFKCSVESLNKSNLIPSKDYNKDKLLSAMLQLPDRFHLIIDETALSTGELNQKGLFNFHALNDVINWQKLNYDFGFHPHEFLTNIRLLVLSQSKSLLNSDCQLKLNPCINPQESNLSSILNDYETNLNSFLNNDANLTFLNNLRKYFTIVSHLDYNLNEPIQKIVEDDFVQMRQTVITNNPTDKERICVEDFHLLMVVARLQTISNGKNELSINEWNRAKYLEKERKARL